MPPTNLPQIHLNFFPFAVKLGITFPTVNRWENLKTKPSPLALQKLQKLVVTLRKKGLLVGETSKPSTTFKGTES